MSSSRSRSVTLRSSGMGCQASPKSLTSLSVDHSRLWAGLPRALTTSRRDYLPATVDPVIHLACRTVVAQSLGDREHASQARVFGNLRATYEHRPTEVAMTDVFPDITTPDDLPGLDDEQLTAAYCAARLGIFDVPELWLADEVFARWTEIRS